VVVMVLVVVWAAVLTPVLMKRHSERQASTSIESFHRQLHLLERAGPKIVPAAHRLETVHSGTGLAPGGSGYPAVSSMPGRPNLVLLQPVGDDAGTDEDQVIDPSTGHHYRRAALPEVDIPERPRSASRRMAPVPRAVSRARARRRRQDILLGLVGTVVASALLGVVPALRVLWVVTGLAAVALVAFLALVATAQRWAAEARMAWPLSWPEAAPRVPAVPPAARSDERYGTAEEYLQSPRAVAAGR
jgi:hypothetical protein